MCMETEVLRKDRAGDHDYRIEVYFERTKQFSEHLLTKATDTLRNTNASKRKNEKKKEVSLYLRQAFQLSH